MKTLTPQLIGPIVLENLRFRFLLYQMKLKYLLSIITVKLKDIIYKCFIRYKSERKVKN